MFAHSTDKPEVDQSPSLMKFASDAGDTGRLICRSQSSPLARYSWARSGTPISANTTGKYYTNYRQVCFSSSARIRIGFNRNTKSSHVIRNKFE